MRTIPAKHLLGWRHAGAVDQSVQRAKFTDSHFDGSTCARFIGHVGFGKARVGPQLRCLRLAGSGVDVDNDHFPTSIDQAARRFRSESGSCSRYHKHTAIDLHDYPQKNIATSRDAALLACADGD
jgi:hypothetical protein